jgi:DNA-binding MarR family transcriptional regulator
MDFIGGLGDDRSAFFLDDRRGSCLSVDALSRAAHLIRRSHSKLLALYGDRDLTLPQFELLEALLTHGAQSRLALTEITGMDRSTIFEMCSRVMAKGLIEKSPDRVRNKEDGRSALAVRITLSGRMALKDAARHLGSVENILLNRLSFADRQKLIAALERLSENSND